METQMNPLQMYVIEKTLNEMKQAEKNLIGMNAYWQEGYEILEMLEYPWELEIYGTEEELNKIERKEYREGYSAVPLRWMTTPDGFLCAVTKINWNQISTKKTTRKITFSSDGTITLSKEPKTWDNKNPRSNNYNASYNVLHDDFSLHQKVLTIIPTSSYRNSIEIEETEISRINNIIIKRHKGIEVREDLVSGKKYIRISKKHDKEHNSSINFLVTLDQNGSIEKTTLEINTHKSNGKVNGTYRVITNEEDGIEAYFCTRKGVQIPLEIALDGEISPEQKTIILPELVRDLTNISALIIPQTAQDLITDSIQSPTYDLSNFTIEALDDAEKKSEELLKRLKDEIPLEGLISRMEECQGIIEDQKTSSGSTAKILRLSKKN